MRRLSILFKLCVVALLWILFVAAETESVRAIPHSSLDIANLGRPLGNILKIAAGVSHTCALTSDGDVKCWGDNSAGQLGNGLNLNAHSTSVKVIGLNHDITAIAAGAYHTCALTRGGAVKCWGNNGTGELGDGTTTNSSRPVDVAGLSSGVIAIAAGASHTCALMSDRVQCWGNNSAGQLGNGMTENQLTPVTVSGLGGGLTALTAGDVHSCVVIVGAVKCWGGNAAGQLGDGTGITRTTPVEVSGVSSDVITITAGTAHTCAIQSGGVKCWGANNAGQLGDGTTISHATPLSVSDLISGVIGLAAGGNHTCALTNSNVKCWGENTWGQLGNDSIIFRTRPVDVIGLTSGAGTLAVGQQHSCAVVAGGVKCWGNDLYGQLGDGSFGYQTMPQDVFGLSSNIRTVATAGAIRGLGAGHTCALTISGEVKCWGRNTFGQLGNNTSTDSAIPVYVIGLGGGVNAITVGYGHTCALENNNIQCWGYNQYGQLGDSTTINHKLPTNVSSLSNVSAFAATYNYTCALTSEGSVECWGRNENGQLGDGTVSISRTIPVSVLGLGTGMRAVANGGRETCALTNGGGVKCWGYNFSGQLGNNTTKDSSTPVDVVGLSSGATAIAVGMHHSCAVKGSNVTCWGSNEFGQLGNNTTKDSSTPVDVVGLSGVITITAGSYHTCALTSIGGVKCWGRNNFGQLGNNNNTMDRSSTPVDVVGLSSGVRAVAAGMDYTCVVTSNGGVKCWGYNQFGQLGDGNSGRRTTPVDVIEIAPLLGFSPTVYDMSESIGTAPITITLDAATDATVMVDVTTHDGTATAGTDYREITRQLIFAPGVITQTIPIEIKDDSVGEGNETFTINLTNAQNAAIDSGTATVTIVDDDNIVVVQDESGNPVANATVDLYVGGSRKDSKQSDNSGRVVFSELNPNSILIARSEIAGAQRTGWPYRVYLTNLDIDADGSVQPNVSVRSDGVKVLTIKRANALVLFDLIVSVEWCSYGEHDLQPGSIDTFLAQLRRGLTQASKFLYKVTDGQFAFGNITIYDCGRHWEDAHIQIAASNQVRPYAIPGGITANAPYTYTSSAQKVSVFFPGFLRMGRAWDRSGWVDAPLDEADAYRTLVHEFLHWAFFLFDEYFYMDEATGMLQPAHCVARVVNRDDNEDSLNASVMYWPYTRSKLEMQDSDNWSEDCKQTEQYQVHGESSWETLLHVYNDTILPPRWVFHFPTRGGTLNSGPQMPVEVSAISVVPPDGSINLLNGTGELTVYITNRDVLKPTDEVQIFLLKQSGGKTQIIDQGTTNILGAIRLVGVEKTDTVLAVSWDGKLFGSLVVNGNEAPTVSLELKTTPWSPLITARPILDEQGNEIGLSVQVSQLSNPVDSLQVTLLPVGESSLQTGTQTVTLTSNSEGVYGGTFTFPTGKPISEAHLLLRAVGQGADVSSVMQMVTTYAIGGAPGSHGRSYPPKDPASSDGYCSFHLPDGTFSSAVPAIVMPTRGVPPLSSVRKIVSTPCYLGIPLGIAFNKPVPLILYYNQRAVLGLDTQSLRIEHFNEDTKQWESLGGLSDNLNYFISAAVNQSGIYVVTASDETSATFYGTIQQDAKDVSSNTLVVALINGQSVAQTTSRMDNGNSVYEINIPTDNPATEKIEGGRPGQVVTFLVNDKQVDQTGIWQPGSISQIDLRSNHKTYLPLVSR